MSSFLWNIGDPKNNFTATVDPTVNNDSSEAYSEGSVWINTVTNEAFILTDDTVGAAVWEDTTFDALEINTLAKLNAIVGDATLDDEGDSRTPDGSAGGDLGGSYPNPTVNDGADSTAIHDNVSGEIVLITEKVALVGADIIVIEDSEDSNSKKKASLSSLVSNVEPIQEDDTLTGTENDYSFSDIETVNIGRFVLTGGDVILTGIVAPSPERPKIIILLNAETSDSLKIQHNDSGSAAVNRLFCPDNSEYVLQRNSAVTIDYDTTSSRWRLIAKV